VNSPLMAIATRSKEKAWRAGQRGSNGYRSDTLTCKRVVPEQAAFIASKASALAPRYRSPWSATGRLPAARGSRQNPPTEQRDGFDNVATLEAGRLARVKHWPLTPLGFFGSPQSGSVPSSHAVCARIPRPLPIGAATF
jgi:hypothetical protein